MADLVCRGCGNTFQDPHRRRKFCSRVCSNRKTGEALRQIAHQDGERAIAWACGGGVDSTAIAVLIWQKRLPPPQYAWIVDVGYEPQTTWDYVNSILKPRLAEADVNLQVLSTLDYTDNQLVKDGKCVLPAYRRREDGSIIRLDTHCSERWKAQVARRWLRNQQVGKVEQWVGISADEDRRVKVSNRAWLTFRYPLVEFGLTRADCAFLIGSVGWPMPERTSCYLCPQRSEVDWRRLVMRSPEDFKRAVAAEELIEQSCADTYLHRSCKPLSVAVNGCPSLVGGVVPQGCQSTFSSCT